jgi:TM2 domain-containing membrane protein YozV
MEDPYRESASPATLSPHKKHCYACANILDVRAELCPRCGVRQPFVPGMPESTALVPVGVRSPAVMTTKNRTAAGIFALVLGCVGVHKFYLGHVAAGILSLVFCWTMIPALIGFVEGVLFLTMSDEEFARKYPG